MNPITKYTLSIPQQEMRRLAGRIRGVNERHASNVSIASAGAVVAPRATSFDDAYGDRERAEEERQHANSEARVAVEDTVQLIRVRIPLMEAHLGRDLSRFSPRSDVPEDVCDAGDDLVDHVDTIAPEGSPAVALTGEIKEAVQRARMAVRVARAKTAEAQSAGQRVRESAVELQEALVMFRRVLAGELGRRHADYRALRARRRPDDADDVEDGAPGEPNVADDSPVPAAPTDASSESPSSDAFGSTDVASA